ncbi:MAG: uroporphyrinogen-III synthase [Gammaproteobacteria bacterium]|nr:uroporphyrinogen-III synthase [Gammaproteobacteria bacterium]
MSPVPPLKNITILVTRPEGSADHLLQSITDAGGTALHYPVIRIDDIDNDGHLNKIIASLTSFNIAIFISPTAVKKTLSRIRSLPTSLTLAAIGKTTASILTMSGYKTVIVPDDFNTESLLEHQAFQAENIANKSIVIFRGVGGRELLGDTLSQRGATVVYAETYQRTQNSLDSLTATQLSSIDALTISSNEVLQALFDLTDNSLKPLLTSISVVVPGERSFKLASELGFKSIIKSQNATDEACIQALINHFSYLAIH